MSNRITKENANNILKNNGYKMISNYYYDSNTVIYISDINGYKFKTCLGSFNRNIKNNIQFRIVSSKNPFSIENIKLWLNLNNKHFKLLSTEYKNNSSKLSFTCDNEHEFLMSWNDMLKSKVCPKCYHRYSNEDEFLECVKNTYNEEYTILGKFINSQTKILAKHNKCGNEFMIKPNHLLQGHGCNNKLCCHVRGKDHYKWNKNLTEYERNLNRKSDSKYIEFIKKVLKRDNYTCKICKKRSKLNVHHLDGYDVYINKRTDIDNGITLCEECHKKFHNIYGYGKNTKSQWNEFVYNFK